MATAVADEYLAAPGQTLSVGGLGVLANDQFAPESTGYSDVDYYGDPSYWHDDLATFAILSGTAHGVLTQTNYSLTPLDGDRVNGYWTTEHWLGLAFQYTPDSNFRGFDYFTYAVSDFGPDNGEWVEFPSTATVTIVVDNAPHAADDSYSTNWNTPLTIDAAGGLLSNDSQADHAALTASLASGPAHGSITLNDDGSFTYTPDSWFSGTDSFDYAVSDGLASSTATATITVGATPFQVRDDHYLTAVNTGLTIDAAGGLLANDDIPGPVTVQLAAQPANGYASMNADGSFGYTPDPDYVGDDSFVYTVNNGIITLSGTVLIHVGNEPPIARDDSLRTGYQSPLTIDTASLLANDTDAENDPLTFNLAVGTAHGTLAGPDANGNLLYTPDTGYTGPDSFTYTVNDGRSDSDLATVSILVNHPPVALADSVTAIAGFPLDLSTRLTTNDTDDDNDGLSAIVVTGPAHGTLDDNLNYSAPADYTGSDSFTYRAWDGYDYSSPVTVAIQVNADQAPVATADDYSIVENGALTIAAAAGLLANDSDADGQPLAAVQLTDPSHGTLNLNPDGSFVYTPATNYVGPDSFTYQASDTQLASSAITVSITVTPDHAPVAIAHSYSLLENDTLTIQAPGLLAGASDPDGQPLTAVKATDPAHGTVTINANGSFTYTPTTGYYGSDSFTYVTSDGTLDSQPATVSLTIGPKTAIVVERFYSDGRDLKIDYSVNNVVPAHNWYLSVYMSDDGVHSWAGNYPIAGALGGMQLGDYTVVFQPNFVDAPWDYKLMVVARPDYYNPFPEADSTNNSAAFSGGSFLSHELNSGRTVLQIQDTDDGDTVTAGLANSNQTLQITDDGQSQEYNAAAIDAIHFRGHDGDDSFTSDAELPIDEWLFAGLGQNTLIGGAGYDYILGGPHPGISHLDGGSGQNVIRANTTDEVVGNTANPVDEIHVPTTASTIEGDIAQVVVSLALPADHDIVIPYTISGNADDYEDLTGGTVTIPSFETTAVIAIATHTASGNADRPLTINYTAPSGTTLNRPSTSAIIYDVSKANPTLTLSPAPNSGANVVNAAYFVDEDSEFTGTFTLPTPAVQDVSITFNTEDGTATSPDNYEPVAETVTIPAGETSATFTIDIGELTDAQRANPGSASFTIHIDAITGASLPSGASLDQTITIVNSFWPAPRALTVINAWSRLADANFDSRSVTVTLTDAHGFALTHVWDLSWEHITTVGDYSVSFPIFSPNTDYTLQVVTSAGLTGSQTVYFNSSELNYVGTSSTMSFLILSASGINYGPNGEPPPAGPLPSQGTPGPRAVPDTENVTYDDLTQTITLDPAYMDIVPIGDSITITSVSSTRLGASVWTDGEHVFYTLPNNPTNLEWGGAIDAPIPDSGWSDEAPDPTGSDPFGTFADAFNYTISDAAGRTSSSFVTLLFQKERKWEMQLKSGSTTAAQIGMDGNFGYRAQILQTFGKDTPGLGPARGDAQTWQDNLQRAVQFYLDANGAYQFGTARQELLDVNNIGGKITPLNITDTLQSRAGAGSSVLFYAETVMKKLGFSPQGVTLPTPAN